MRNGTSGTHVYTRRESCPRTHALRDAVREAIWGEGYDPDLCFALCRIDNVLLLLCVQGQEVDEHVEAFIVGMLWQAAMRKERTA